MLCPIGVDLKKVNAKNVMQIFDDWYDLVNDVDSEMLEPNFGGNLLVARNVYNAFKRATHNHERSVNGNGNCGQLSCLEYQGIRLRPMNYMPKDAFMYAAPQDLLVGVDLVSDATNFEQWREPGCNTINFKGAMSIGFQIKRVNKVSGTFCDTSGMRLNFQELMPCSVKKEAKSYPAVVPSGVAV